MQLNSVVGGYKVIEMVGEGGMGTVFRGLDILLEREVALKLLRPELTHNPHLVKRFRTEAVALARLNHPHIVTLHQLFRDGDNYFMVLEFVLGETLDRLIKRCGPIPWQTALPLICQALEGLEHAHILKVIHRDIKPANLILTQTGVVKLMDFGVARMLENSEATQSGYILGTLKYMSPEQIQGHDIDYRVDIYAIGMVLYELLTSHAPFDKRTDYELIRAHVEEAPKSPRILAPKIPPRLDAAVLRALAKSPADRFQSAAEFRGELETILKAESAEQDLEDGMEELLIFNPRRADAAAKTFSIRAVAERLRAAARPRRNKPAAMARTVVQPQRGTYAEPRTATPALDTFKPPWSWHVKTAALTLLLPAILVAFYLSPIDLRSPPEETPAPQPAALAASPPMTPPLDPIVQAAIDTPPAAGIPRSALDAPSGRAETPAATEPIAASAGLAPADTPQSSLETAPQPEPSAENTDASESPPAQAMPQMTAQAGNPEDMTVPDKATNSKRKSKSASHRGSSSRKKLDGGWTIISN